MALPAAGNPISANMINVEGQRSGTAMHLYPGLVQLHNQVHLLNYMLHQIPMLIKAHLMHIQNFIVNHGVH